MSTLSGGPNVVMDGLVLWLDAANPKSYVSGSTTWNDISRSGINGTLVNGSTYSSTNGGSIAFDGVNDYVSLPNNPLLDITDNFTITIIFKSTNWTNGNQEGLFAKGSVSNYAAYLRGTLGSTSFYTSPTAFWDPGPNVGGTNLWNIITFIYSYSQLGFKQIYNNGSFSSQISLSNPITSNTSSITLGYTPDISTPRYFKGNISSFSIYNRVLSQQEILQNYNAVKSRFGLT